MGRGGHGRGGPHCAMGRGGHRFHTSFTSSESSSDSDTGFDGNDRKKLKKHWKKHFKRIRKFGYFMGRGSHCMAGDMRFMGGMNFMSDQKTVCTLCCHRIKPLVDTEVLNCGHIYHRLCLKELMDLSQNSEPKEVFCSQCKDKIDENLINQFKQRFNGQTSGSQNTGQQLYPVIEMQN